MVAIYQDDIQAMLSATGLSLDNAKPGFRECEKSRSQQQTGEDTVIVGGEEQSTGSNRAFLLQTGERIPRRSFSNHQSRAIKYDTHAILLPARLVIQWCST